ncbi:MAG: cyclic nucleotide-binding domain-containing protein, partial [Candidatus Binatia bacterium]
HLMSRLSAEVRTSGEQERAVLDTLSSVGKPALYASLLLILGFFTLLFSSFVPIRQFGTLSAATIAFALVGEILLTPALLSTTRIITLWDVLYLKLGEDPHRTIGIFHDLRPWQAKVVALMGELRSFPHGEPIIRQGETGDAMFVIINGRAEVTYRSGNERRRVRELGRGDVFGEMGLIRRHERTADVVALGDVETMAMNEQFLARLQRRYPRIANRILVNVARVLADRLQAETARRG